LSANSETGRKKSGTGGQGPENSINNINPLSFSPLCLARIINVNPHSFSPLLGPEAGINNINPSSLP